MSFFIEYREGQFIDAEKVNWIEIKEGQVSFTVSGEPETIYICEGKYACCFINNMQALNLNFNLERRYHEINKTVAVDEI